MVSTGAKSKPFIMEMAKKIVLIPNITYFDSPGTGVRMISEWRKLPIKEASLEWASQSVQKMVFRY